MGLVCSSPHCGWAVQISLCRPQATVFSAAAKVAAKQSIAIGQIFATSIQDTRDG
jgi:hypothetical protein